VVTQLDMSLDARNNRGQETFCTFVLSGRMRARKAMLPNGFHVRGQGRGFGVRLVVRSLLYAAWTVATGRRTKRRFFAERAITYLLRGLSPQANYTDGATAACRRS
jgi:hypothetical protein